MTKSKSVLEAKYLRSRVTASRTQLWKNFSGINKHYVVQKIKVDIGKEAVLIYFKNPSYWWVLTINKFILLNQDDLRFIELDKIVKILPVGLSEDSNSKNEIKQLLIELEDEKITIETETKTWHVIYELLRFSVK